MIDKLVKNILNRPFFIFSFLALFIFLGFNAYFELDKKLFPNSNRPEIAVVIVKPSASAKDMANDIATIVEKELYSIDYVRRVYSSTIDEVSVIRAEFNYEKNINDAANDVANAINKIRSQLPKDIKEPQINKITAATAPIITLGISSKKLDLIDMRELIETNIQEEFLKLDGVANVDIFGGYKKEIQIVFDISKLNSLGLSLNEIIKIVESNNKDFSIGNIENSSSKILLKSSNQKLKIINLKEMLIAPNIKLKDVAKIDFNHFSNTALYRGNKKDSIALSIQRNLNADVIKTIHTVENRLKILKKEYPYLNFEVTDTQKTTIVQSNENMIESLRDAIIMSTLVVFLFLASIRQIFIVLFTIPIVYLSTIALMWLFGLEFNIITLTGVILALGLLLDDTVVVVENIQRHYDKFHEDMENAVFNGTSEIMFADFSGTLTTMIALFPILFVGDYPQTIFAPLITTLLLALAASYIVSITFVPLISKKVLALEFKWIVNIELKFKKVSDFVNKIFINFFLDAFKNALKSRLVLFSYIFGLIALFIVSARVVMPLVGQELMPGMDTGTVKIKVSTTPNISINQTKDILKQIEEIAYKLQKIETISSCIGSESGVLSIGSGGGINDILILVNYVNRFQRNETIWEIETKLKEEISKIKGIKTLEISDAGATAMASIKANIDVTLFGDNFEELYKKALEYEEAMRNTKGIVTATKSWHMDSKVYKLDINAQKALEFGISNEYLITSLQSVLKGVLISSYKRENEIPLAIRVLVDNSQINTAKKIENILIYTGKTTIPLSAIAKVELVNQPNIITRENLYYTIDIFGFREKQSISKIMENFNEASKNINLPSNIKMKHSGDIEQFEDSSKRIIKSVAIGLVLIFLVMIPMFESLKVPLVIIFSIPLTIIGASWILLLLNYHSSMSAMVGFILLAGVIVNNAILLIHFASLQLKNGLNAKDAMLESIKVRTRPVLMTAISVSVGMIPVAFGWAIGMERLAPLGAVVIGGLLVGTFLTLLFIPLLFVFIEKN